MPAAALFDLDETVLDRTTSLKAFVQWQANGMLLGQIACSQTFVGRFLELDNNGKVWKDKVYRQLIDEFSIKHWTTDDLLQSYMLCFCGFCKPRSGIQESLEYLKKHGIRMGIVTNGKSPFQERNFRALAESVYFDAIFVSESIGVRKPDKSIFELACNKLGADLESSIFVGDNPIADIRGAKQAGMKTIYVPIRDSTEVCVDANFTVINLQELPNALDCLLRGDI